MDEDDIYPDSHEYAPPEPKMQDVEDEEEGEELESDSDDDIKFITDAKDDPKTESGSQKHLRPGSRLNERENSRARHSPTPATGIKRELTPSDQANINRITTPQSDGRPGTDYPARHTSTLDPTNGNPVHPSTGKPIFNTDLDADFPDSTKPWRKPGADITDYFNYGFDEFTWASYCLKKQSMPGEIKAINQEAEQMKAFFDNPGTSMPMPGIPGLPGVGLPDMPGMPSQSEMQQMMEFMKMQGITDPSQMSNLMMGTPNTMGQGGQQPPVGPAGFGGGQQDGFQGRGRGRGRGRNW